MSSIVPFNFETFSVRVVTDDSGEPWFVAADVCDALEIGNPSLAVNGRADRPDSGLDADEKGIATVNTSSGDQQMLTINESGLYSLILTSRKPETKKFKKWVTSEVLPSIRKTGKYEVKRVEPVMTWPAGEEATRVANAISDCLRLDGTSRAAMLRSILQDKAPEYVVYLPAYATNAPRTTDGKLLGGEGNSKAAYAATALLTKVGSPMNVRTFNKIAELQGILETHERPSTKHQNVQKQFKAVSAKGLAYGYNLSNENAKGTTQPVWFESTFRSLLDLLGVQYMK